MTQTKQYGKYKQAQIQTASPGKLILLLYQGAISSLKKASELLEKKDYGGKGDCLIKAQDIIMELNMALDMSAGQIAQSLRQLYLYIYRRLLDANLELNREAIEESIGILEGLYEAWMQAVQETDNGLSGQMAVERLSVTG